MGGIEHAARGISGVLGERLPWQRKTQRENLALLVATMLSERSANLMALAATLPREPARIDMPYQWIVRVLANPLSACDAVCCPSRARCWHRPRPRRGQANGWTRRTGGADPGSEPGLRAAPDPHAGPGLGRACAAPGLAGGGDLRTHRLCGAATTARHRGGLAARGGARAAVGRPVLRHARPDRPLPGAGLGRQ